MSVDPKLQKWLRETGEDLTPDGPFTRIHLLHASSGNPDGTLLQEITCNEGSLALPEFAQELYDLAEQEASTYTNGQSQRFVVLAFRLDAEEYERRFAFAIKARQRMTGVGEDTTPPNEVGLTAQLLRHDVENHRLIVVHSTAMAERQEQELARNAAYIAQLERQRQQSLLLQEDLLDRKAERELRFGIEKHKANRLDQAAGMVLGFLPLFFAHIAGGKNISGSPIATTARDMAVGTFLKGLSEEEGMRMFNSLSPEHKVMFMEFYKSYREDDRAANAGKPEVLRDEQVEH